MKGKILLLIIIIVLGTIFVFQNEISDLYLKFLYRTSQIEKVVSDFSVKEIEGEVLTPGPLHASREYQESFLTKTEVIQWTNFQRKENKLASLTENAELNAAAALKLQDMFEKQFFAHISPSGIGVSDLVKEVGYEFIVTGENLAMGNFKDDKELVQSWMDSPGHRENILNELYQEIGVAVGRGLFEGKQTWLAVQIFGLSLSICPQPDKKLEIEIDFYENKLKELQKTIELLQAEIESMHPKKGVAYNQKIREYNRLVNQYNNLVSKIESMISEYNTQVGLFNECVETHQSH